jgi:hypothetical protein
MMLMCHGAIVEGCILMSGANGHLYEVLYNQSDAIWGLKCCTNVYLLVIKNHGDDTTPGQLLVAAGWTFISRV